MSNDFDVTDCFTDDCEILVCEAFATHLSWIDTSPIASVLDGLLPSNTIKKWIYSPLLLFKLLILQDKKVSSRRFVSTLALDECIALGMEELASGHFRIPRASTEHHFARERLGLAGFNTLMCTLGKLACKHIQSGSGMI